MRSEVPLLTKSDYVAGLHCPKRLYLRKFHRDLEALPTEAAKVRMMDGNEIGAVARRMFPGGILIEGTGEEAFTATRVFMESAHTLFEAQFQSAGRVARVDVLQKAGNAWRVIEVKSSKEPKDGEKFKCRHLEDLAFQILVLRESGVEVASANLMLLSRDFVLHEAPAHTSPDLFKILDVTEEVEKLLMDAEFRSIGMLQVLSREEPPEVETNTYCSDCGFHSVCHVDQQLDDLVFLPRIKAAQVTELRKQGFARIGDIPNSQKLTPTHVTVRNVFRDGKPFVSDKLSAALQAAEFPVHFIDFETTAWAIPVLPGTSSHDPIPFQWSCHTMESLDGPVTHSEFLSTDARDPRAAFAESLWRQIREGGSIFVYSNFELSRLKGLARSRIAFAEELQGALERRGIDLLKIVENHVYFAEFRGSFSIKSVLPALVQGLGYDDLVIKEGDTASVEYKRMIAATTPTDVAEEIASNLLAYCQRDTEAMVLLYKALWKLCENDSFDDPNEHPVPEPDDTKHEQLVLNI